MGKRGYFGIGLDNPKNGINVGSVLRAAGCYDAAFVAVSGPRPRLYVDRMKTTDTMCAHRHLPLFLVDDLYGAIPHNCIPVAVELMRDARPLFTYQHPQRAFYVFGAEDATLGKRVLDWCEHVIYIPTRGSMNLAACVNVVLYDRMRKGGMEES